MTSFIEQTTFLHPVAGEMAILCGGADSRFNKPEVLAFCKRHRDRIFPIAGDRVIRPEKGGTEIIPYKAYFPERDDKGKALPNSMVGYRLNTVYWKQWIYGQISNSLSEEQTWFMPIERDEIYERHLQSEEEVLKRKKGSTDIERVWQLKPGYSANHFLDATLYGIAIAHVFNLMNHAEDSDIITGIYKPEPASGNTTQMMTFPKMTF